VDTHAKRLARRIGLTTNTDPYKIELDLAKIIPPEYQALFSHQLVWHGRQYCKAQKPFAKNAQFYIFAAKKFNLFEKFLLHFSFCCNIIYYDRKSRGVFLWHLKVNIWKK
jgi:hypothetical protein